VLEDLEKLRENAKRGKGFNKKLSLWFYRRIQFCVEYEAKERGLKIVKRSIQEVHPLRALGVVAG